MKNLDNDQGNIWIVYLVRCADDTLYAGITNDLGGRLNQHNHQKTGAKYTRSRRPVTLVHKEIYADKSLASKREYEIKQLNRTEKLSLIEKD